MKAYYSINTPGLYYICERGEIDEELRFAEALQLVVTPGLRQFILSNSDSWHECPAYPGVYSFAGDYVPRKKPLRKH